MRIIAFESLALGSDRTDTERRLWNVECELSQSHFHIDCAIAFRRCLIDSCVFTFSGFRQQEAVTIMVNHHSNGGGSAGNSSGGAHGGGDYSGDDRSGGEERERLDGDLHDKPTYLLEHLATFTVNKESGIVYPADGMRRLLQLEKTTGIWSQKMQLCLDYQWVLIMDYETGVSEHNYVQSIP